MKTVPEVPVSPLASFFNCSSESVKRAAYSAALSEAVESQRRVLEEAKRIKAMQANS